MAASTRSTDKTVTIVTSVLDENIASEMPSIPRIVLLQRLMRTTQHATIAGSEKNLNEISVAEMASMVLMQQLVGMSSRCGNVAISKRSMEAVGGAEITSTIGPSIEKDGLELASMVQQWKPVYGSATRDHATMQHSKCLEGDCMKIVKIVDILQECAV